MIDTKLNECLIEIFEDVADVKLPPGSDIYIDEDGIPVFTLNIEQEDGAYLQVSYTPPMKHFKRVLKSALNENELRQLLSIAFINLPDKTEDVVENHKKILILRIQQSASILHKVFDSIFRQAANDIPELWAEIDSVYGEKTRDRLKKRFLYKSEGKPMHAAFERPDFDVQSVKTKYAENRKKIAKKIFDEAASILPKDIPPKKILFSLFYNYFVSVWKEAHKFYKENKKRKQWREMIRLEFFELPLDLIGSLASPDKEERMPSSISLIHAARLCEIDEKTPQRTLQQYLKESKQWFDNSEIEAIENTLDDYNVQSKFRLDISKLKIEESIINSVQEEVNNHLH